VKARKALELEPECGDAQLTLAAVALDHGDLPAARELLARAERLIPGTVGVALITAELALAADDPAAAALVQKALAAVRNNPLSFAGWEAARLLARLGERVDASPMPVN
jgi:predicted Zn-dependent protease